MMILVSNCLMLVPDGLGMLLEEKVCLVLLASRASSVPVYSMENTVVQL